MSRTGIVGTIQGSASFMRLNAHLLSPQSSPSPEKIVRFGAKDGAQRIRQNAAGLNKTEQAFADWLIGLSCNWVLTQATTLKLGNGVRYTPDFLTVDRGHSALVRIHAYEVKGFMRDDAAVKLKVAAAQYPWIKFHLVTKKKGGGWDIQEILP